MIVTVRRPGRLRGTITPPGDKSVSHRALMFNAIAAGTARVTGLGPGDDIRSTAACLVRLGVRIENGTVHGRGLRGLQPPAGPLDCGNSGTTMRLLAGILAGQRFPTVLTGDASLRRRPMDRVAEPLRQMGAEVRLDPLTVAGGSLIGRRFEMVIASAQVKSAILLAGLYAEGETSVVEPVTTRNHTELLLAAMGAEVMVNGRTVRVRPAAALAPVDVEVPGDLSAAAFWLVLAGLHPDAELVVAATGVNPTRNGLLDALTRIGVPVEVGERPPAGGEPVADLRVTTAPRPAPFEIAQPLTARVIDELPVLAVAAALIPGRSVISGAGELRVKESDRIRTMAEGLSAMGASVEERPDGWVIEGGRELRGTRVSAHGDHRVAMAMAVAGMLASGETEIAGAECASVSYPGFWTELERLGATV